VVAYVFAEFFLWLSVVGRGHHSGSDCQQRIEEEGCCLGAGLPCSYPISLSHDAQNQSKKTQLSVWTSAPSPKPKQERVARAQTKILIPCKKLKWEESWEMEWS
jgi:hypothetical protein